MLVNRNQFTSIMIKFSKESQITFFCLLIIPVLWSGLNYFGFLDYLKTKSVDWRMQFRGEIPQTAYFTKEKIIVDDNLSIPKVPKVTYVNFDAATLAMDDVGERPWDRAFFRDMAFALIERGNARVLAFDFGFTPKSMSKLVPPENSYRSDMAMGELISRYPERVVLGCLYSGVPTPFVKNVNSSAFPPLFKDGYSWNSSQESGKYNYPESPTYPLINFTDNKHIGRLGSFTVPPFRAVDEIPRWVPLWFPSGGKAHAYNLLGGKKSKLYFELPNENSELITKISADIEKLEAELDHFQAKLAASAQDMSSLTDEKSKVTGEIAILESDQAIVIEAEKLIQNFSNTLKANPALDGVISPQIKNKEKELSSILENYLLGSELNSSNESVTKKLAAEKVEVEETLSNLKVALGANPALSGVIGPQIKIKEERLDEIVKILDKGNDKTSKLLSSKEKRKAVSLLKEKIKIYKSNLKKLDSRVLEVGSDLAALRAKFEEVKSIVSEKKLRKEQLGGSYPTELVEQNNSLLLTYSIEGVQKTGSGDLRLVDSFPNRVPLTYEKKFFTLGLEALLAYYGLNQDSVLISEDKKKFRIIDNKGKEIVGCKMVEGQFLEINWFSKWTDLVEEEELLRKAKKFHGDGDYQNYLKQIEPIFFALLSRAYAGQQEKDYPDILKSLEDLGIDSEVVAIAERLLNAKVGEDPIPSFDDLTTVATSISYYFISPRLESVYNPMCGMRDVLENARFQNDVTENISQLENKIRSLEGPNFLGKIQAALKANPQNEDLIEKKKQVENAILINKQNLNSQREELRRIDKFFASFNDAIVMIGPEEATFQDLAPTPFDKATVPKVSVHGNLIKTLTSGKYIKRLPVNTDYLATFIVCILMAGLAVYQGNRASLVQACGILLLAGYIYFGFMTFSETHVVWPITVPACAGLSTSFVGLAAMVVIEQKAKGKLKGMFGSYVSSDLVDQMVESGEEPKLGGEETGITAFFSDVQAFSSFSELLTPTGLVDLMNEYLTAMTNILQEERGTLDKYIGDAIVAMYGAPIPMDDHAYQAVRTAILMQQKQIQLREKWVPEAEKWGKCHGLVTQMQTRIGCNTGTATVGNMGALDRFNYTMMGDMVNLAARCESGAKAYGAYIMVTEETKIASELTKDDIAYRYLDKIVVKGRSQPVAMYEPTGFMSELTQETQDCLDCFSQGIEKYLRQDWLGALSLFEKAKELEPNRPGVTPGVKDNPSMILIDRCKVMQENPPGDDWDGVYVMTTK